MLRRVCAFLSLLSVLIAAPRTVVSIQGDRFYINGQPTYKGRTWQGHKIEGLLLNSRMVQGSFDDANPATAKRWAYKDSGKWDAERNTREFLAAMPEWRKHGLLAINAQSARRQPGRLLERTALEQHRDRSRTEPPARIHVALETHSRQSRSSWGWPSSSASSTSDRMSE